MGRLSTGRGKFVERNVTGSLLAAVTLVLGLGLFQAAAAQQRIVILPYYVEKGWEATDSTAEQMHYRRMVGFVANQFVRQGFEVIDPFAADAKMDEYNRLMQRAKADSALVSREMCKRYATDAAYIMWLKVKVRKTEDGLWRASAIVDGQGYDSAARSLGAAVNKTFHVTKYDRDEAIVTVEKEIGDEVGRTLTAWAPGYQSQVPPPSPGTAVTGGVVDRQLQQARDIINTRLDGATEYEALAVFGRVINTVTGVVEARRYAMQIVENEPQKCYSTWRVALEGTDAFRFQENTMKMINDILDAGGNLELKGVVYRYTPPEVNLLMGIRPGSATAHEVQFVIDRDRMRDREMSGTHDPYNAVQKKQKGKPAFD
jgi:hypothetical protein